MARLRRVPLAQVPVTPPRTLGCGCPAAVKGLKVHVAGYAPRGRILWVQPAGLGHLAPGLDPAGNVWAATVSWDTGPMDRPRSRTPRPVGRIPLSHLRCADHAEDPKG